MVLGPPPSDWWARSEHPCFVFSSLLAINYMKCLAMWFASLLIGWGWLSKGRPSLSISRLSCFWFLIHTQFSLFLTRQNKHRAVLSSASVFRHAGHLPRASPGLTGSAGCVCVANHVHMAWLHHCNEDALMVQAIHTDPSLFL